MYRVLVADDERLEREALQFVLQQLDDVVGEVALAANGRQAIERATLSPPDIAIVDIKMPGINGIQAARRIKELHPRACIVFLTAFNYFDYAQEAIRLHADDFLIKPVSNERIEQVVRGLAAKLANEQTETVTIRNARDDHDLAESKLIGDAILGHVDEAILRRYLEMDTNEDPPTMAVVLRTCIGGSVFKAESTEHDRILRRRALALLRQHCARVGARVLASSEASTIYALLILPAQEDGTLGSEVATKLTDQFVSLAGRELGVDVSVSCDGPRLGFSGLGLRFASAKTAGRSGGRATGPSNAPSAARADRRRVLDAEKRMVRGILSGERRPQEELGAELFESIQALAPSPGALRDELAEAMTYIAHATAMQLGRLPGDVAELIRSLADPQTEPNGPELRLGMAGIYEQLLHHASESMESIHRSVVEARQYIDTNFARDLSLDQIAEHVRMSPFHLARIFKSAMRCTVMDYVTQRRIDEAQRLMRESRLSIKEIAADVGYADQNYFSRVFRRLTGTTPSTYRKAQH